MSQYDPKHKLDISKEDSSIQDNYSEGEESQDKSVEKESFELDVKMKKMNTIPEKSMHDEQSKLVVTERSESQFDK
jgi:hypothetical protein